MKTCTKCKEIKEPSFFYKDKAFKDGLRASCKSCDNIKTYKNYRKYDLKKRYGLTISKYNEMSKDQDNKCAICNKHQSELTYNLCVDHNHLTGEVRKLLCKPCNLIIGNSMENADILVKAIQYLGSHEKSK